VQGPAYARLRLSPSDPDILRLIVSPHLTELSAAVGETTHLMILEGTSIRFIFSAEGQVRYAYHPGSAWFCPRTPCRVERRCWRR
jgi:DNA-binding IclR family transcriptional regulator